jgi:hypothetical protein
MGSIYKLSNQVLTKIDKSIDAVFVEIGSERGEGSTSYFSTLAKQFNQKLITVDVDKNVSSRLITQTPTDIYDNIQFVTASGSSWAKDTFPTYNKKITCLYLDNFDYNWDVQNCGSIMMIEMIKEQQREYLSRGIVMNNLNCQAEHLLQMLSLIPYMSDTSIIICDDTYRFNDDCFLGKCGAVIPLLITHGYIISKEEDHGIILSRNIEL